MSYALWNPTAYYLVDDEVLFNGSIYRALSDNFNSQPPSVNWVLVPPVGGVNSVVAGTNVTITGSPNNPTVNAIVPSAVQSITAGTNLVNVGTATNAILDVSINANILMNTFEIQNSGNINFSQSVSDARIDGCKEVKAFGGADLNLNNDGGGSILFTTNSTTRGSVDGNGKWNFNNIVSMNQNNLEDVAYISSSNSGIIVEQLDLSGDIRFIYGGVPYMNIGGGPNVVFSVPPTYSGTPLTNATLTNKLYVDSLVFSPIIGSFSSSATQLQTGGVANTPTAVTYNTTEYATTGVSIFNNSGIRVTKTGVYKFSYSIQLDKSGGGVNVCDIWIRINGNNVPRSTSQIVVAGTNGETLPFCEYILPLNANDYVEVIFMSADATMAVTHFPAVVGPPSVPEVPSIIANIIQIK